MLGRRKDAQDRRAREHSREERVGRRQCATEGGHKADDLPESKLKRVEERSETEPRK